MATSQPLINTLTKFFGLCDECSEKRLQQFLEKPYNRTRAEFFLRGKQLRTKYKDRNGDLQTVRFGGLSIWGPAALYAYQGYLGMIFCCCLAKNFVRYSGITVQQHFYSRHRVKLRFPKLGCVIEYGTGGDANKYYPIGL